MSDDVDQTAPEEAVSASSKPYSEGNPDHVPNPLHQRGSVDTTGTGGDLAGRVTEVTDVFAIGRAQALGAAAQAVDEHPTGRPDSVIFPDAERTYDEAARNLSEAAEAARTDPQVTEGITPAQQEAAEEGEPVNPNALRTETHDYGADTTTAPPTSTTVPDKDAQVSTETGVPQVHPNAESVEAAQTGTETGVTGKGRHGTPSGPGSQEDTPSA